MRYMISYGPKVTDISIEQYWSRDADFIFSEDREEYGLTFEEAKRDILQTLFTSMKCCIEDLVKIGEIIEEWTAVTEANYFSEESDEETK